MEIFSYNAPVTLTFAIACSTVVAVDSYLPGTPVSQALSLNVALNNPIAAVKSFTYIFGHQDWAHLFGNLGPILLLGPALEEKYGATRLVFMMALTAVASGVLSIAFFHHGVIGASGIVFLFVALSSFANRKDSKIPLTFVLVALLFLVREVNGAVGKDNVSQFAHLAGGAFGALFGFAWRGRR